MSNICFDIKNNKKGTKKLYEKITFMQTAWWLE
jgi:hypothetical protein